MHALNASRAVGPGRRRLDGTAIDDIDGTFGALGARAYTVRVSVFGSGGYRDVAGIENVEGTVGIPGQCVNAVGIGGIGPGRRHAEIARVHDVDLAVGAVRCRQDADRQGVDSGIGRRQRAAMLR
jgi:hypothetical protein